MVNICPDSSPPVPHIPSTLAQIPDEVASSAFELHPPSPSCALCWPRLPSKHPGSVELADGESSVLDRGAGGRHPVGLVLHPRVPDCSTFALHTAGTRLRLAVPTGGNRSAPPRSPDVLASVGSGLDPNCPSCSTSGPVPGGRSPGSPAPIERESSGRLRSADGRPAGFGHPSFLNRPTPRLRHNLAGCLASAGPPDEDCPTPPRNPDVLPSVGSAPDPNSPS